MSIVVTGRAARTGTYFYEEGDPTREQTADKLFDLRAMRAWIGTPVLVGHYDVTLDNIAHHAVGYVSRVWRDRNDGYLEFLGVELVIFDPSVIRDVESGWLVEMSPGWKHAGYDPWTQGAYSSLPGHLALLEKGRARGGPECRLR